MKKNKNLKEVIKNSVRLFTYNLKPLIPFLLIILVLALFSMPEFTTLSKYLSMNAAGYPYLSLDILKNFITTPLSVIIMVLMYIIETIVVLFELSGLLFVCRMSDLKKKTTFKEIISYALHTCKRVIHPKNWAVIILVFLLLQFTGVISASSPSLEIRIPEFISDFIFANNILRVLFIILVVALTFLSMFLIFALPIFVLSDVSFFQACKKAKVFVKSSLRTFLLFVIATLAFMVMFIMLSGGISSLISAIAAVFSENISNVIVRQLGTVNQIVNALIGFIAFPAASMAIVYSVFIMYRKEYGLKAEMPLTVSGTGKLNMLPLMGLLAFFAMTIVSSVYFRESNMYYSFRDSKRPEIVAHRGDSVSFPENTMPAFEAAITENPECTEFDVHQTKDGVIIVSHDDYIKRVSGKDTYVHENTYEDLMKLDVGSWFDEKFSYVRFSTLDEVLKRFKDTNITLQIEIKPTEYDDHIEESVLSIIKENDMFSRCVITSLKEKPLKRLKEIDPNAKVVYSMALADGYIDQIDWADQFTIEEQNVTADKVERIHQLGKKCYAWTINTPDSVQHLVDCNVDGILTDNPLMLREELSKVDYEGGISKLIRMCFFA